MHRSGGAAPPPADADAAAAFLSSGPPEPDSSSPYGPEITAGYDGECSECWGGIFEGDAIRADGEGGWVHSGCADD